MGIIVAYHLGLAITGRRNDPIATGGVFGTVLPAIEQLLKILGKIRGQEPVLVVYANTGYCPLILTGFMAAERGGAGRSRLALTALLHSSGSFQFIR